MTGLNLNLVFVVLLLIWAFSVIADAAGTASVERGGAGRSHRRGGGGGGGSGGGSEKRRRYHRIQHNQCSYTFILPELDSCQGGGPSSQTEQYGGSRAGASGVQRDSPPIDAEWSVQKLQQLESTMENNTQWLQKEEERDHQSQEDSSSEDNEHLDHSYTL
ncbi:hypothetical protein Q8A73_006224 [Channa argus]|nr:hypothetical protein Q8A73_006224 [Channa argus]